MAELNKLLVYMLGIILGGIFVVTGLLAENFWSTGVIVIGVFTIFCSLVGIGIHDSR